MAMQSFKLSTNVERFFSEIFFLPLSFKFKGLRVFKIVFVCYITLRLSKPHAALMNLRSQVSVCEELGTLIMWMRVCICAYEDVCVSISRPNGIVVAGPQ